MADWRRYCDPHRDEIDAQHEFQVLAELPNALAHEQFILYYQPVVSLPEGTLQGFEALVRWQHPTRGLLPPSEFLSLVEQSPFFRELGLNLLAQAVQQVVRWNQQRPSPLTVNVNFSARQMLDADFPAALARVLEQHHCDPTWIKVEITETDLLSDVARALSCLEHLKSLGVKVMLDDFGTGFSSLSYLHRFPVAGLKIDRSFVLPLETHAEESAIVQAILLMASSLGLEVVAEGIETLGTAARLAELGCRLGQGYVFAKPLAVEQASQWLSQRPQSS